jgi:hypothetical protein
MSRKAKFKPEITRVKLNPEQAVLTCACYNEGWAGAQASSKVLQYVCRVKSLVTQCTQPADADIGS